MDHNVGQEDLIRGLKEAQIATENNTCGMTSEEMSMIANTIRIILTMKNVVSMSREQLARFLGVSTKTIYRRVKEGKLPKPKRNGFQKVSYNMVDVERAIRT